MFDFDNSPAQIIIPTLYQSPYTALPDKPQSSRWHSQAHIIQDENIDPSIAAVDDSYISSHSRHRRQRSLSIGIGHPSGVKHSLQQSRQSRESRPPLSIRIPNVAPLHPIRRRIFNTACPAAVSSPACRSMPTLQAVSDWVAASHKRARDTRDQRAKVVAHRILALHNPKTPRLRLPASEFPRPYVKSSLSQSFSLDA